MDTIYGSPRIEIPSELPDILKHFTKAAIRTQPKDILQWAAAYFRALASGIAPPVKERIEFISSDKAIWITLGLLRVLHRQLGDKEYVSAVQIKSNWDGLCLDVKKFAEIMNKGKFTNRIHWITFLAVVCSAATTNVLDALRLFCEVVTKEPEGYPARVPVATLLRACLTMFQSIDTVHDEIKKDFTQYLTECGELQDGCVHPGNFLSPNCPKFD